MENNPALAQAVEEKLRRTWSPEEVAGTLGVACHATLYAWISRSRPDLKRYLRRRGRKRRRYGTSRLLSRYQSAKRPLALRPALVLERSRLGDWEGDTARGGDRKSALLVHEDLKSNFVLATPLPRATADVVQQAVGRILSPYPRHTLTYDNGSEFALHQYIEKTTRALVYFARPGHPEERGSCENAIGLLREFFPKGTNFATMSPRQISQAVWLLNHRPRKRLSWQTPCKVSGWCCTSS